VSTTWWCAPLNEAGFTDATVWDEAYGRVMSVTIPWVTRSGSTDTRRTPMAFRVHEPQRDAVLYVTDPDGQSVVVLPALFPDSP
jgi:hypothetical protein